MRYTPIFLGLFLGLMAAGAFAGPQQTVGPTQYANPYVVAHPASGENVLLYPGGQYGRVAPTGLKEPGEKDAPIRLHMPKRHVAHQAPVTETRVPHVAAKPAPTKLPPAKPASVASAPVAPRHIAKAPAPERLSKPAPAPQRVAKAAPPAKTPAPKPAKPSGNASGADTLNMTDLVVAHPVTKTARTRKPADIRVAKAEPAPKITRSDAQPGSAGTRNVIPFDRNASSPGAKAVEQLAKIAQSLERELGASGRVQILAYAGDKGDKSSAARRLSLKRAIIVRQLLIDDGIPSDRIDVRAMGGISDAGPTERVDIFLKG